MTKLKIATNRKATYITKSSGRTAKVAAAAATSNHVIRLTDERASRIRLPITNRATASIADHAVHAMASPSMLL